MRQLSLVAFYGQKDADLQELIRECQKQVAIVPGIRFQPYDMQQIHATIVSLERLAESRCNLNLTKYRNRKDDMDFGGLLNFIRAGGRFPFQVQIGGFQNRSYPFTSWGQTPYQRSFQVKGDKIILIGWPIRGQPLATATPETVDLIQESRIYPNTLDDVRRTFQTYNVLHGYHRGITDVDNDFYFRIGLVDSTSLSPASQEGIGSALRAYLASVTPIILDVTISHIYVVSYDNNELPLSFTKAWSISDASVTADFMWDLYR